MALVRGDSGPAVLLVPGGVDGFFPGLVEGLLADPGCRVMLHDRAGGGTSTCTTCSPPSRWAPRW